MPSIVREVSAIFVPMEWMGVDGSDVKEGVGEWGTESTSVGEKGHG